MNLKNTITILVMTMISFFACKEKEQYHFTEADKHFNKYQLNDSVYFNHKLFEIDLSTLEDENAIHKLFPDLPVMLKNHELNEENGVKSLVVEADSADVHSQIILTYSDSLISGTIHHDDKVWVVSGNPMEQVQVSQTKPGFLSEPACNVKPVTITSHSNVVNCSLPGETTYPITVLLLNSQQTRKNLKRNTLDGIYFTNQFNSVLNKYGTQEVQVGVIVVNSNIPEDENGEVAPETLRDSDWVKEQRDFSKADVVGILTSGGSGRAIGINNTDSRLNADNAFFFANYDRAVNTYTAVHEWGHILGMFHNREDAYLGSDLGPATYCGYGYYVECETLQKNTYGSIMSYKGIKLGAFSNADATPLILCDNLGVSCSDDKGRAASNVQRLAEAAPCVSKFR